MQIATQRQTVQTLRNVCYAQQAGLPGQHTVSGDDPEPIAEARGARRHAARGDAPNERVRLKHRDEHLELAGGVAGGGRHVRHDRVQERRQARVRGLAAGRKLAARPPLHMFSGQCCCVSQPL